MDADDGVSWPPPASLVPHAGPMCLFDEVVAHHGETTTVRTTLSADMPCASRRTVGGLLALELIAQAGAVHAGLRKANGAREAPGFVVSCRRLTLEEATWPVGSVVDVAVTVEGDDTGAMVSGTVISEGRTLASARLTVYRSVERG